MFLQYSYDKLITDNIKNVLRKYSEVDRFKKKKKKNRSGGEYILYFFKFFFDGLIRIIYN